MEGKTIRRLNKIKDRLSKGKIQFLICKRELYFLLPFITCIKAKEIPEQNKIKGIGIPQLTKIPTLFPDWRRSLNCSKG